MTARDPRNRSARPPSEAPSFELERFAWGAPDRLELSGAFTGLGEAPDDAPVLVLSGGERTYRLPAAADDVSGQPRDGELWHAAFVWQEAPAAFATAVLELGPDVAVDLPEPGISNGADPGPVALAVRTIGSGAEEEMSEVSHERTMGPEAAEQPRGAGAGAELIRVHAELLAAREEIRDVQVVVLRVEEELTRARADVVAEREARAADSARFREGLAEMQRSAEEAVAAERSEWMASQAAAESEIEEMRARLEHLAVAGEEADRLRARLIAAQFEADEARRQIEIARDALESAQAGASRLSAGLTADGEAQDGGG